MILRSEMLAWTDGSLKLHNKRSLRMTHDIRISDVDAIKGYIETTKKMIERVKSGDIRRTDPNLDSLTETLEDLRQRLNKLKN
jgi:hypothetical protein